MVEMPEQPRWAGGLLLHLPLAEVLFPQEVASSPLRRRLQKPGKQRAPLRPAVREQVPCLLWP